MKARNLAALIAAVALSFSIGCASQAQPEEEPERIPTGNPITYVGDGWTMEVQDCWDIPVPDYNNSVYASLGAGTHLSIIEMEGAGDYLSTVDSRRKMLEKMFEEEEDEERVYFNVSRSSSTVMTGEYADESESEYGSMAALWAGKNLFIVSIESENEDVYAENRVVIQRVIDSITIDAESSSGPSATAPDTGANASDAASPVEQQSDETAGSETADVYPAGAYRVGKDIPAGEYLAVQQDRMGLLSVYSDTSKSDYLIQWLVKNQCYFTVEDGQYLDITGAVFSPRDDSTVTMREEVGEGMYLVGVDIPSGEYRLTQNDDRLAMYNIYSSSGADYTFIDQDLVENQAYVVLSDGQYLALQGCSASLE
ncbi:MAG: hypothetical protein IJG82_00595 [Atopobiaceae bacterium]|nr:hypothetical protein [Atopobiaceae bacterium]MBQ6523699.1 hypothetical protein [Atopobiaceae bacterium]